VPAVATADGLETAVLHALTTTPDTRTRATPADSAWNVPSRLRTFMGRQEVLEELHRTLTSGAEPAVCVVHGIGGVGKTTTATEYAHRYGHEYDVAWWVPAENPSLIPGRLGQLACTLNLATSADSAEASAARLLGALRRRQRCCWFSTTPRNHGR